MSEGNNTVLTDFYVFTATLLNMSCYSSKIGGQEGEWREGEREGGREGRKGKKGEL